MSDMVERLNTALEGRYAIERELGEGGMATVYLADDLKHERKVALKVLKPELAAVVGAERFLAEIKTTANLTHPHILPLHDSGEADGFLFYVMPHIEGESLRERIDREKQLGVDDAVAITQKVAGALDYAHENGVVHRDIKPGNVLLSGQGEPLVADFGIALAVAQAGAGRITETGLSLGTPHYMSPEQATGDRDVDPRSDVYALGCVLYEMLAGQPPFSAPTAQAVLVQILTSDAPSITNVRRTVSPNVGHALARALEKLPADRFTSAAEFAAALGDPSFTYEARARTSVTASTSEPVATVVTAKPWHRDRRLLASVVVGTALAAWGWLSRPPLPAPGVPTRAEVTGLNIGGPGWRLAISPDGRWIVAGHREEAFGPALYIRAAEDTEWRRLPNTEDGTNPTFSPDGQSVAFRLPDGIWKVPITGGPGLPIAEGGAPHWALDDTIVYDFGGALYLVSSSGGEPELLLDSDTVVVRRPHLLPNGKAVVFGTGGARVSRILIFEIETGEVRELLPAGNQPRYVSTGHLIYGHSDGALMGVPFDLETLQTTGSAVTLLPALDVNIAGASNFAVSESGTLIYQAGGGAGVGALRSLVWVDRDGREEPIEADPNAYFNPRISPDGRRVALETRGGGPRDIWIWNFDGETLTRLILGVETVQYPVWTPSGERVVYGSGEDLYWKASNNTGVPEILAEATGAGAGGVAPYFFAPDGAGLVFRQGSPATSEDLIMISVEADAPVIWRLAGEFNERNAELSPDGRWMAYQSDASGEFEIYVRPFPQVEEDQVQVSNNGGRYPLWSRDGRELFYLQPGPELISVSLDTGEADQPFTFGDREVVMDWPYFAGATGRTYDVSPEGERFLAITVAGAGEGGTQEIYLVTNWFEELRERVGIEGSDPLASRLRGRRGDRRQSGELI